jgi:hypothetical protein
MRELSRTLLLAIAATLLACAPKPEPDDGETDTPTDEPVDTDGADTDPVDTDADPIDTDPVDTDPIDTDTVDTDPIDTDLPEPLPGYGVITGACGVLDDGEWLSASAFRFRAAVDLGPGPYDPTQLGAGAQEILADGTLGGSSGESEALAFDLLYRCEGAALIKSESEVEYTDPNGRKTDILVELDARRVGVSVTRALTFQFPDFCAPVNGEALTTLITRKVDELAESQANATPADAWERAMLYVIACDDAHADETIAAFDALDPAVRRDAILIVTATAGADDFLY